MANYTLKKIVHGTQRALDRDIERLEAQGWAVERREKVPRGEMSKLFTYAAYLKREKADKP